MALGFAYVLVSVVTYDAQAHGEMLDYGEPHDQKACGFVRDLGGLDWWFPTGDFRLLEVYPIVIDTAMLIPPRTA